MSKYFVLIAQDLPGQPFGIHFGDFDRQTVKDEQNEIMGRDYFAASKILETGPEQAAIDAAVAGINAAFQVPAHR